MTEQIGGRLILKSRLGEGTTAELWLPVAENSRDLPYRSETQVTEASARHRSLRVLAVDDDALVLFNTTAMLEELGHNMFEAKSGFEALETLKHRFDHH